MPRNPTKKPKQQTKYPYPKTATKIEIWVTQDQAASIFKLFEEVPKAYTDVLFKDIILHDINDLQYMTEDPVSDDPEIFYLVCRDIKMFRQIYKHCYETALKMKTHSILDECGAYE